MATMRAVWNGEVIAESDDTVVVEGNHYFPPESLRESTFSPSSMRTMCPWKGVASYYDIEVDGRKQTAAAWYYGTPSDAAANIKDHVAFWKDVVVERAA